MTNWWVAIPTFTATVAWLGVIVVYWLRAKWWKSSVGWNTMGISVFIALALLRLAYTHVDAVPAGRMSFWLTAFGVLIYGGLTYFGAQRICLILDAQRQPTLRRIGVASRLSKSSPETNMVKDSHAE